MKKYNGSIVIKFDTDATGNAGSGKPVTVYVTGTLTKADLFEDNEITPLSNPVTSDSEGNYFFTVADGEYDLVIDEGLPSETSTTKVQIVDATGTPTGTGMPTFDTITAAINSVAISENDLIFVRDMEYTPSGGGENFGGTGGANFKVVLTSGVTPNGLDIRQSSVLPLLSLQLINTDTINTSSLNVNTDGIDRAAVMLTSGNDEISGGTITFPTGRQAMTDVVKVTTSGTNNYISMSYEGQGKMSSSLNFINAPALSFGFEFEGGIFYSLKSLNVYNSRNSGVYQNSTPVLWNHVRMEDIRINSSLQSGIEAEQGFMGVYDSVWSTGNGNHGFEFKGLHTSLGFRNTYAVGNTNNGYDFRTVSYSTMNSCASESNGFHGYEIKNSYALTLNGCGSEDNQRAGFYLNSDATHGNNRNISLDGLLGIVNNQADAGWANLLHMRCADSRTNTAMLTNSWGRAAGNPTTDVIVDGDGAYLVEGYNVFDNGVEAKNEGYIQHLPKHFLNKNLSVTTSTNICGLASPQGHTVSYGGTITVMATNVDPSSTAPKNHAIYKMMVTKGASGTFLTLDADVEKLGDVNGLAANQPSFTWTVVSDNLRATPVGLTSDNFWFEVLATGFVKTTDIN